MTTREERAGELSTKTNSELVALVLELEDHNRILLTGLDHAIDTTNQMNDSLAQMSKQALEVLADANQPAPKPRGFVRWFNRSTNGSTR